MYSEIIAGTMRWGEWGANHSEKEVQHLINVCLEEDIFTFDHADIYGGHTTESLFGNAFSKMNIDRSRVQLISKCGIKMPSAKKAFDIKSYDYSQSYILNCVDESLKNLKTDYLDVLLLHRPSPLMDPKEVAAAFGILRSSGKVLDFGVSNFSVSQFDLLWKYFPYLVTNQIEFSVNHTEALYNGTIDQMQNYQLNPMAWSVLGNYFSKETEQNWLIKKVIKKICKKYDAEENQLLLAFIRKHPARILPVVGTSNAENLKRMKQSVNIDLEAEDWFRILEASRGKEVD